MQLPKFPKPIARKYPELIHNIQNGTYQIPKFQRDLIWSKRETASLIDSMVKGFPIGALTFWKTKDRMRAHKKFGGAALQSPPLGESVHYVLDGQQRITSLFLAIQGIALVENDPRKDYGKLFLDLSGDMEAEEICVEDKPSMGVALCDLLADDNFPTLSRIEKTFGMDAATQANRLKNTIAQYEFATIEVEGHSLESAVEIFTRINTSGQQLSLVEIISAKVYREETQNSAGEIIMPGFDLENEIDSLVGDLEQLDFETVLETNNQNLILHVASAVIRGDVRKKVILNISKEDFISMWEEASECLKKAVENVRDFFQVPVSKLLPYPSLLVPIAYFFHKNKEEEPDNSQLEQISKFFFRTAFDWRYQSGVESKINQDLRLMDKIAQKEQIDFGKEIPMRNETEEYFVEVLQADFEPSNAFDKATLCILAAHTPRRFNDNVKVNLTNKWLRIASSRNYHHFFPKSKVKNHPKANSRANIVFIDDYLNKRVIGSQWPSKYIGGFRDGTPDRPGAANSHIASTLETHFISMNEDGIWDDDFDQFLKNRARCLAREILKKIK